MSEHTPSLDRFWTLLDAACDGSLSETQADELVVLLESNPAIRKEYARHMELRAEIRLFCRAERACGLGIARVQHTRETAPVLFPAPTTLPSAVYRVAGFVAEGMPLAYLIATVVVSLGLLLGSVVSVTHPGQLASKTPYEIDKTSHGGAVANHFVGRITGMVDPEWIRDDAAACVGSRVPAGRQYALASGLIEITYDTGARVLLQGPATFQVESASSGFLAVGKLTARVERKGERKKAKAAGLFAVRTPSAVVTDLGTEFGVEVESDGSTSSHVFEGSVQITGSSPDSDGQDEQLLLAGQAAHVDGKTTAITVLPLGRQHFVRSLPVRQNRCAEDYGRLVLSLNPAVYYRLDQVRDDGKRLVLFDATPEGCNAVLYVDRAFFSPPRVSGPFGNALLLRGPAVGDYAIVPDYPKAKLDQLSVSVWVMALSQTDWGIVAANWGDNEAGQFQISAYGTDGDPVVRIREHHADRCADVRQGAGHPFQLGQWQHIAFIADGKTLRLYRNGSEVASGECQGVSPTPPTKSLMIGCRSNDAGDAPSEKLPAFWHGRVDELAVFNYAISAEDVRRLAELPPKQSSRPSKGAYPAAARQCVEKKTTQTVPDGAEAEIAGEPIAKGGSTSPR